MWPAMRVLLKRLLTPRFFKFCAVGASGVIVNMGFFFLFADLLGMHVHLALVLAIEISILSNFAVNEAWTFRDRREPGALPARAMKFHAVSAVGGGIQWAVFAVCNALVIRFLFEGDAFGGGTGFVSRYITDPADVGAWKYLSQLVGIGAATLFNFGANAYWTWGRKSEDQHG